MTTPAGARGAGAAGSWIKADEVRKAGDSARKVATEIPDGIKTLYAPTDAASKGLWGFQLAAALDDCVDEWAKALKSLAELVTDAADAVAASAKSSHGQEAGTTALFASPGAPSPSGSGIWAPPAHTGGGGSS